jgi:hypothetical protein
MVSFNPEHNLVFVGTGSGAGFRLAPGIAREALDLTVAHRPDMASSADATLYAVSMDRKDDRYHRAKILPDAARAQRGAHRQALFVHGYAVALFAQPGP